MSSTKGEMPFLDHLEEMRWRIIWSLVAVVAGSALGILAVIRFDVITVLTNPLYGAVAGIALERPDLAPILGDGRLVFLNLTEPFFFTIKLGLIVGLLVASPVVVYHAWAFLAPALEERERRVIIPSMSLGLVLFAAGVALAYFVALPLTIRFLLIFGSEWFTPALTAGNYLPLVIRLLLAFGVAFELPVVVMILTALGLVTPALLRSKRRHAIVGIMVFTAFLSPGDFVGVMLILAVPMVVLYEFSIVLSSVVRRQRIEGVSLVVPLMFLLQARDALVARRRGGRERAEAASGAAG